MNIRKFLLLSIYLFLLTNTVFGQDTIRLEKKPHIIIKSWYPEFKEFPTLKIGESKILFIIIPDFKNMSISGNDINLITSNNQVQIEETEKLNQYLVKVNPTTVKSIEFELWLELGDNLILLKQNSKWENIKKLYPTKGNRILIDKIVLELIE